MATIDSVVSPEFRWPEEDNRVPRDIYTDPAIYQVEMQRVFSGPVWSLVAHDAEIPNPGDFKTTFMGDIPVIVVRNMEGRVNVLVNTCAHRGAQVMERPCGNLGKEKLLTCIYHHWNYDLNGELRGATMPDDFPVDFSKDKYGLAKARVDSCAGAIFATFSDETPPLDEYLGDLKGLITAALGDGKLKLLGSNKALYECNWKLFGENMYDGYHALVLHKALQLMKAKLAGGSMTHAPNYDKYGHVCHEYRSLPPEGDVVFKDWSVVESRTKDEPIHYVMNVFPVGVVQNHQDTIALRFVIPRGVDKTELQFVYFGREGEPEETLNHRIAQASNLWGPTGFVSMEDATVLGRVQDGAHGRGENVILKGTPKRFPPYRLVDEAAVRHFYDGYRRLMGF
jgi:anthranilate 1,2-dioxygenase large subunit